MTVEPPPVASAPITISEPPPESVPQAVPETEATAERDKPSMTGDALRITATVYQEDMHWQGNVQLEGWITVAPQATLTISPGTVIRLGTGGGIHVLGRIVAKGSTENPVLFTSQDREASPGGWRGIVLSGSEKNNILDNVRIEGAETALLARFSSFNAKGLTIGNCFTGLQLQECVASLVNGRINNCNTGIMAGNSELSLVAVVLEDNRNGITLKSSSLIATEVTLTGNESDGLAADDSQFKLDRFKVSGSETGARITRGEGSISASVFRDNSEAGLVLANSRVRVTGNLFKSNRIGLQSDDNLPVLWGNALIDNKGYNLLYLGEESYYAGGNWFGNNGGEGSEKTVFSKRSGALQTEPLLSANPLPSLDNSR